MGPYNLVDDSTHWECFSLRFFDEEEIMLFSFSQHPYTDGTYVVKDAKTTRLQNYEITPREFIKRSKFDYTFSYGWDVVIPGIKEEKYEIHPLSDSQFNVACFELLAEIINPQKNRVGYCVVELICEARNSLKFSQQIRNLMKKRND